MELRGLEIFVLVAEQGSLIGAARKLGISPPSVTRAIAALEAEVATQLFTRTTRQVKLTPAGERFATEVRAILAALAAAVDDVAGESTTTRGHLSVTASVTFGRTHVAELLLDYLHAHTGASASLLLLDRVVDLVDEGIDVAVRIGELPDSSLIARKLGSVRRVLVASPDYLARRGTPTQPRELLEHDVIAFTGLMPGRRWRYREGGKARELALAPLLELNDASVALRAAERGQGISVALSYMVGEALAERRLVTLLDAFTPPPVPVQLVIPPSRVVAARVRRFLDFAAQRLGERLAKEEAALQQLARPRTSRARRR
jgi:DNA-binding transcriptional LysR family regulator